MPICTAPQLTVSSSDLIPFVTYSSSATPPCLVPLLSAYFIFKFSSGGGDKILRPPPPPPAKVFDETSNPFVKKKKMMRYYGVLSHWKFWMSHMTHEAGIQSRELLP